MLRIHEIGGPLVRALADSALATAEQRLARDGCAAYGPQLGAGSTSPRSAVRKRTLSAES